jgi:hypothetical protein
MKINREFIIRTCMTTAGIQIGFIIWRLWYTDAKREAIIRTLGDLFIIAAPMFVRATAFFVIATFLMLLVGWYGRSRS